MNIHHLELFYYVAKHGGVSAAARKIPYGIQQPAISAQIIQLEGNLATKLFTRRPFRLTRAGEDLYQFVEPFFSGLDGISRKVRGGVEMSIRIGALESIQRDYLPGLLKRLQRRFANLQFTLVPANLDKIEALLLTQQIDIGIAPLLGKRPDDIREKEIARVRLGLLVPAKSSLRRPDDLWKQDRISEPLITGRGDDPVCHAFHSELRKRKVDWFTTVELSSQDLIQRYVAEGFGVGLVVIAPGGVAPKGTRLLCLTDFPSIPYGLLWMGAPTAMQTALCEEAQKLIGEFPPDGPETSKRRK